MKAFSNSSVSCIWLPVRLRPQPSDALCSGKFHGAFKCPELPMLLGYFIISLQQSTICDCRLTIDHLIFPEAHFGSFLRNK